MKQTRLIRENISCPCIQLEYILAESLSLISFCLFCSNCIRSNCLRYLLTEYQSHICKYFITYDAAPRPSTDNNNNGAYIVFLSTVTEYNAKKNQLSCYIKAHAAYRYGYEYIGNLMPEDETRRDATRHGIKYLNV